MTDLISRLEQATEASRELDIAIHEAITGEPVLQRTPAGWLPYYTASLDAAVLVVPPDCGWICESCGAATVHRLKRDSDQIEFLVIGEGRAETPVLALTIAALKAHEHD